MSVDQQIVRRPSAFKRQYIINPGFQIELISFFTGALLICLGGFYWGFKKILAQSELNCEILDAASISTCKQIFDSQHEMMFSAFILSLAVGVVFVMVGGVILSHRAAGPLFRLKKYFSDLAEGKTLTPLTFRKKDYFMDTAEVINRALNKLANK